MKDFRPGDHVGFRYGLGLSLVITAAAAITTGAPAQTLTTLYSFTGGSDGAYSQAGLIADAAGNLYGTTPEGGVTGCGGGDGCGVVFELTAPTTTGGAWAESVLHSFANPRTDGAYPLAGLIADASGNLYSTASSGGASAYQGGTVFKLSPPTTTGGSWTETVLHNFAGGPIDGAYPLAGLVADAAGNLYGTTSYGGTRFTSGTVFKLAPSGTETVLYNFTGGSDGGYPVAGLTADALGNLYGATTSTSTVFKLTPSGAETVLYSFTGGSPLAGLIADASGNLYGTTSTGGANNEGAVFKLTPSGTETVLYSFTGGSDGGTPLAGLIADAAGNLYSTTSVGGAHELGTVFKVTPSGTETVLYSFTGGTDGAYPLAGLLADASGNVYGTTQEGGAYGYGTVFKLTVPATFNGVPGQANCIGQSVSFLARKYGGISHAATVLGYAAVIDLQNGIISYCGG